MKNYFECQPALNYGYAHPDPSRPRALKKSPFFMTKTENAYDL